uniref:Lecithin retinol acyltransferase b, tandem duplicate 1 n=1 Tax=Kryptolebias marmoratus TaxID=37003 RepID=A0A3Q3G8B3_KRYMA
MQLTPATCPDLVSPGWSKSAEGETMYFLWFLLLLVRVWRPLPQPLSPVSLSLPADQTPLLPSDSSQTDSDPSSAMLDTLTFLLERLFLLAHIKLSSLLPPPARDTADPQPPPRFDSVRFQRGDLLEVPRTLFTHFGIYLGENRVAHLIPDILPVLTSDLQQIQQMVTNTRLLLGVLSKRASVRVDSVEDFAYGAVILQNAMDRAAARSPLAGEEVARRAEQLVGAVSYSLLWNNCEHFVTHCRYGSAQTGGAEGAGGAGGAEGAGGAGGAGGAEGLSSATRT